MAGKIKEYYTKGDMFGELEFIEECERISGRRAALFRCKCGKEYKTTINSVKCRKSKQCICYRKIPENLYNSYLYLAHKNMKSRCYNVNYHNYNAYGGRGITVCDRWLEPKGQGFLNFYLDVGERPGAEYSIDRIDVNGNYEPENVKWSNPKDQCSNRRTTILIEYKGETKCIAEWSRILNISWYIIKSRYIKGLPLEV